MEQVEPSHEEGEEDLEVMFREDDPRVGSPIPRTNEQMPSRSAVGFGESQLRHVRHQQGRARARERAGAALRGNARGAHGISAEM